MSTLQEQLHDAETENASFSKAIAALPRGTAPESLLKPLKSVRSILALSRWMRFNLQVPLFAVATHF